MVAPVTPDTSGTARRPDNHSDPDTPPVSLNSAANVFGLARYGNFCSDASKLIIESMDALSDQSSSAAQKKAAMSNMRLLATKLAEVDSAMVSAAASSNKSIHSVKKAVAKLRNEEEREVVGDPSPRSRKKQKSDALASMAELKLASALELGDGWKSESDDAIASALEMKDPNNASKNYFSAGELEALVKVRRWKSCRATRSRPKIAPRKGDAAKAKECLRLRPAGTGATPLGQNFCTIYQVLIHRNDPWILDELPEEAPAAPSGRRGNTERRHPVIVNAIEGMEKLPSDFLDDDGFIEAIEKGDLIGSDFSATAVSAEMKDNGNDLHRLLRDRLKWRKDKRLDPKKHGHWSIRSFERNLGALAAIDVKGSRVIDDVKSADRETCFLRDPIDGKFLEVKEGEASGVHGNYNRFDERRRRYIRTGFEYDEESSRDVVARVREHVEAANLRTDGDKKKPHYRKYPHKDAAHLVPDIERDGYAHDLKSYVGIGFKNTATSTITDADGLFDWDEETVKGLQASNDGCSTLESKKRKLVAYWFELLDDLKIPMKHSVSESFGIEAYLRTFG